MPTIRLFSPRDQGLGLEAPPEQKK